MGKIIAIGGGGFTSQEYEQRTGNFSKKILRIDEEILRFSGIAKPNFLFIPTASSDDLKYVQKMEEIFKNKLSSNFDTLFLIEQKPSDDEIKRKISQADIIYVGGGNTLMMMNLWRKLSVDKYLIEAYSQDKVMCGVSAGSICWFRQGNSDSRKYKNSTASMIKVTGLGIIDALHCPHYDSEPERKPTLKTMMKNVKGIALAIDDCSALQIKDDKYRIISAKEDSNAYKVYWNKNEFVEEKIENKEEYTYLNKILNKK